MKRDAARVHVRGVDGQVLESMKETDRNPINRVEDLR